MTAVTVSTNVGGKNLKRAVLHLCPDKGDLTYEVKIYEGDKYTGSGWFDQTQAMQDKNTLTVQNPRITGLENPSRIIESNL